MCSIQFSRNFRKYQPPSTTQKMHLNDSSALKILYFLFGLKMRAGKGPQPRVGRRMTKLFSNAMFSLKIRTLIYQNCMI